MPHNLSKVQRKIAKKKGRSTSLHENSRDAQKLRRASARSDRLEKLSKAKSKAHEPLCRFFFWWTSKIWMGDRVAEGVWCVVQRISFFAGAARATTTPLGAEKINTLVQRSFVPSYFIIIVLEARLTPIIDISPGMSLSSPPCKLNAVLAVLPARKKIC